MEGPSEELPGGGGTSNEITGSALAQPRPGRVLVRGRGDAAVTRAPEEAALGWGDRQDPMRGSCSDGLVLLSVLQSELH